MHGIPSSLPKLFFYLAHSTPSNNHPFRRQSLHAKGHSSPAVSHSLSFLLRSAVSVSAAPSPHSARRSTLVNHLGPIRWPARAGETSARSGFLHFTSIDPLNRHLGIHLPGRSGKCWSSFRLAGNLIHLANLMIRYIRMRRASFQPFPKFMSWEKYIPGHGFASIRIRKKVQTRELPVCAKTCTVAQSHVVRKATVRRGLALFRLLSYACASGPPISHF
jgi:hypothetical protein